MPIWCASETEVRIATHPPGLDLDGRAVQRAVLVLKHRRQPVSRLGAHHALAVVGRGGAGGLPTCPSAAGGTPFPCRGGLLLPLLPLLRGVLLGAGRRSQLRREPASAVTSVQGGPGKGSCKSRGEACATARSLSLIKPAALGMHRHELQRVRIAGRVRPRYSTGSSRTTAY